MARVGSQRHGSGGYILFNFNMAHGEALTIWPQIFTLCSEQNYVSDVQNFEVSDKWTCKQQLQNRLRMERE
jgi:hypothetical protein